MTYLWTEDTGAGFHFWELVNQLFFGNALIVESKGSNQGILEALSGLNLEDEDKYYIAFDHVVDNQDILSAIENHSINLSKIEDERTLQYLYGFKRYSTERVMKSLAGEFTQNEKWSVKGTLMGECWYKDCCVSEHPDNRRCGKPEVEEGNGKMRMLIQSEEVQRVLGIVVIKEK